MELRIFILWISNIIIIYFVVHSATALVTGPNYPTFCPGWIWLACRWPQFFILFTTCLADFLGRVQVTPRPRHLAVPPSSALRPCTEMVLPIWPTLLFSGFLPEISSPTALSKVTCFFLARWNLQVSATENNFLFESFDSSKMNA